MKIQTLQYIVSQPKLHAQFLNTLSYLENCGARKIAAYEHPTKVKEEMLKHAAEEFRHALFFKMQISKVDSSSFEDYSPSSLLGGFRTLHYLNRLNIHISRFLKNKTKQVKEYAYLLVTYAIEVRATELYSLYEQVLRKNKANVFIKSVLFEEKEHLAEIEEEMLLFSDIASLIPICRDIEANLWNTWVKAIM